MPAAYSVIEETVEGFVEGFSNEFRSTASTILNEHGFMPDVIEAQTCSQRTQQGSCRLQSCTIPARTPEDVAVMGGLSGRSGKKSTESINKDS
jgi:hypothetical protein